ncbi:MAG: hypothetical protein DYG96_12150 [Chlorobi bacterium CHB2]|nr:hypothetical protein [Chlorobi bacterium CHB2]
MTTKTLMEMTEIAVTIGLSKTGIETLADLAKHLEVSAAALRSARRIPDRKWDYMRWTLIERLIGPVETVVTVKLDGKKVRIER